MLTPKVELADVPAVPDSSGNAWKVRALFIDGKSPALAKLAEWEKSQAQNFKKIITALKNGRTRTEACDQSKMGRKMCKQKLRRGLRSARVFNGSADDVLLLGN